MQPEKDQIFIFTESELSLIKNTFSDNDELLYAIRNVLLQFPLSDGQKALISTGVNSDVIRVLRKRMLPDLEGSFPLGQLSSLKSTLAESLKVLSPNELAPQLEAKLLEESYLDQQLKALENKDLSEQPITLADLGSPEGKNNNKAFVEMTAYLFLVGYIDPSLSMIKNIAGQKDETLEEQKRRMTRDSSK